MPRGVYERKPRAHSDAMSAPPQERKPRKKYKARAPRARPAASSFLPAVDAELQLVLIDGTNVVRFNEAQTLAIATLLHQHYQA